MALCPVLPILLYQSILARNGRAFLTIIGMGHHAVPGGVRLGKFCSHVDGYGTEVTAKLRELHLR